MISLNFNNEAFKNFLKTTIKAVLQEEKETKAKQSLSFGDDELLSRKETASLLKIGLTKLAECTRKGVIPAYRIENQIRYKKSEVLASLKKVKAYGSVKNFDYGV